MFHMVPQVFRIRPELFEAYFRRLRKFCDYFMPRAHKSMLVDRERPTSYAICSRIMYYDLIDVFRTCPQIFGSDSPCLGYIVFWGAKFGSLNYSDKALYFASYIKYRIFIYIIYYHDELFCLSSYGAS